MFIGGDNKQLHRTRKETKDNSDRRVDSAKEKLKLDDNFKQVKSRQQEERIAKNRKEAKPVKPPRH